MGNRRDYVHDKIKRNIRRQAREKHLARTHGVVSKKKDGFLEIIIRLLQLRKRHLIVCKEIDDTKEAIKVSKQNQASIETNLKKQRSRVNFMKDKLPEVAQGRYWFTDDTGKKFLVKISELGPSAILEVGTDQTKYVDSVGVGEFIGPLTNRVFM